MLFLHCKDRKFSPSFDFIPYFTMNTIQIQCREEGSNLFPGSHAIRVGIKHFSCDVE